MQTEWKSRDLEEVGAKVLAIRALRYSFVMEGRLLRIGTYPDKGPVYEYTLRIVDKD